MVLFTLSDPARPLKLLVKTVEEIFKTKPLTKKSQERFFMVRGFTELVLVCWRRSERVSMW